MTDGARHLRQVLLSEIGTEGQRRIARGAAAVAGPSLANEVATRYASGAGFGAVIAGAIDVDALAPASICATPAAREVLAGARAALSAIRAVVVEDRP